MQIRHEKGKVKSGGRVEENGKGKDLISIINLQKIHASRPATLLNKVKWSYEVAAAAVVIVIWEA
jgi:hypothetical protein